MLTVYAPAKINLVLEVLGKLDDYHRVSSIVQSIDLCDVLDFELDSEISLECDEPSLERDNLVTRAAALLKASTKYGPGARIVLRKHIPWGVGLGGGSSDAATTLLALNELWQLALPLSELVRLASKLGSDVPFFIHKGTALVGGRGEIVTPLPPLSSTYFVLLVPPLSKITAKTKRMYDKLDTAHFTEGQFVEAALSSLRKGKRIDHALMFNIFRKVAFDLFPQLGEYGQIFEQAGAPEVHLAGSGPCLYTFFTRKEKADEVFLRLRKQGLECYLASSVPPANIAAGL
ncbi:MAG: 4-(cytidine 5'-diphospho)-2-C-methyl-D-erythritol kinase [Dehalococcoidia bacterium]